MGKVNLKILSLSFIFVAFVFYLIFLASGISLTSVFLNVTSGGNLTTDNLTAYPIGAIDHTTLIYDWRVEDTSVAVVNMPFDTDSDGAWAPVRDYSTYGINGTTDTGATWNSSGISGGAYDFNGVSNEGFINTSGDSDLNLSDFSFFAWVAPFENDTNGVIVSDDAELSGNGCGTTTGGWLLHQSDGGDGTLAFRWCNSTSENTTTTFGGTLNQGAWYHIGMTFNSSGNLELWVDGVSVRTTSTGGINYSTSTPQMILGCQNNKFNCFSGTIDEILLFDRIVSDEQIVAMYNSGTPQSNLTVSQETTLGENWSVMVTPNNASQDGESILSNSLEIISDGAPFVSILYPENTTYGENVSQLNYSASDVISLDSCWYSIDEGATNSSANDCTSNFTGLSSSEGLNTWISYVNDTSGNENSSIVYFTYAPSSTNEETGSSSSSGGGGGSSTVTYSNTFVMDNAELSEIGSISQSLGESERLRIKVSNETHHVGVVNLTETTAVIEIASDSVQVNFNLGDENKFDVTGDNFYDLLVRLNSISGDTANISLTYINEEIPAEELDESSREVNEGQSETFNFRILIIIVIVFLAIAFLIILGMIIKNRKQGIVMPTKQNSY